MKFDNKSFLTNLHLFRKKNKPAQLASWKRYREPGLYEYVLYLSSPFKIFFHNLLAGIGRGLGFVLGATVVVAIVAYIVSKILVDIPLVGKSFQWFNQILQESMENQNIRYKPDDR